MAIMVVINPSCTRAEFLWSPKSCFLGHVREGAVAIIVKQMILAVGGDEDVVTAVVIIIADGYAHAIHFNGQARLLGHVRKCSVVIVAIEGQRGVLAAMAGPVSAVHKQNVFPAVAVVIEKSDAGAHGFGQPFVSEGAIIVDEMYSRSLGHIFEMNSR